METVGASPGVFTVRVLGAVERVAGFLEGFARVAGRQVGFGEARRMSMEYFPKPQVSARRMPASASAMAWG
jgi:hypothetical protein